MKLKGKGQEWFLLTHRKDWFLTTVQQLIKDETNFFTFCEDGCYRVGVFDKESKKRKPRLECLSKNKEKEEEK